MPHSKLNPHLLLVVALLCSCLTTPTSALAAGTTIWNPPIPPSKFTIKARMFYPSQTEDGSGVPAPISIRIWVDGDDISIVHPLQGHKMYTHFNLSSSSPSYATFYDGNFPANQSLHCYVYNGYYEVGSMLTGETSGQDFPAWWIMANIVSDAIPWSYAGETIDVENDDKATVTGVIWNKNFDYGSLALLMDKKNLKPVRIEVGGSNSIGSDGSPLKPTDGAYVFHIDHFSEDFDSDKVHIPSNEVDGCIPDGRRRSSSRRLLQQGEDSQGTWEDELALVEAYYTTFAKGLAEQLPPEDFLTHLVNYTMGPKDASKLQRFSLLGGAVTSIKNQWSCGSCWVFSTIAALETAVAMQSGGTQTPTLSQQYVVNCIPGGTPLPGVTPLSGCDGGTPAFALEFIAQMGSVVPLISTYPYAGVNGKCRTDVGGFDVKIQSFSNLGTIEEVKNSLLNYGAVSVVVDATSWQVHSVPNYAWTYCTNPDFPRDHAVNVIGWQPCMWPTLYSNMTVNPDESEWTPGECWVVLNSWAKSWGLSGTILIPIMEPGELKSGTYGDCGILQNPANHQAISVKLDIGPYPGLDKEEL